jgi:drug/metabolite transporter (DMT)-like permease
MPSHKGKLQMRLTEYQLGLVLITASAVVWSTAGFFDRLIPLEAWTVMTWRGVFSALGVGLVLFCTDKARVLDGFTRLGWQGWLYTVVSGLGMVLFIKSLDYTTVAHVSVIFATVPFAAAGLGWIVMRERPQASAVLASLIAFAGMVVMVGLSTEGSLFGDGLAFLMMLGVAVMTVIARKYPKLPIIHAACLSGLLSGAIGALMTVSLRDGTLGPLVQMSGSQFGFLALFGLANSALGLVLFTMGARRLPAIETGLIVALDAPLAPLWVWLAFQEVPSFATFIGGGMVFGAVGLHVIYASRSGAQG